MGGICADGDRFQVIFIREVHHTAGPAEVIVSSSDTRTYNVFDMDNGLRVLVISDPTTDYAAAAVDVSVRGCV